MTFALQKPTGVFVGSDFVCALANYGMAYCWGNGQRGRLGSGDYNNPRYAISNQVKSEGTTYVSI